MRLMNPGLGEYLDRLSILELKLAHSGGQHFGEERMEILQKLFGEVGGSLSREVFVLYSMLAAVNAAIWQAEDELRVVRAKAGSVDEEQRATTRAAFLGMYLQTMNDKRAELVHRLSVGGGRADTEGEKLT